MATTWVNSGRRVGDELGGLLLLAFCMVAAFLWMFFATPLSAQQSTGVLAILSGDGQTGLPINTNIGTPMAVTIHQGCSQVLKGCLGEGTITWAVVPLAGKAQVYPASLCPNGSCDNSTSATVATINQGQSTMYFHTNGRSGPFQITATNSANGQSVTFNLTSVPGPPAQLVLISGGGQVAGPGPGTFPIPTVVQLMDVESNPVAGKQITFHPWLETTMTDSNGYASQNLYRSSIPGTFTYYAIYSEAVTLTASFPMTITPYPTTTINTSPIGLPVTVDGTDYNSSPQSFQWAPGSSHTIATPTIQQHTAYRYEFASWSDLKPASHTIIADSGTGAQTFFYTATFKTLYQLTKTVSPQFGGTISASPASTDGYYVAGTSVQVAATPASGYSFTNWSQELSGSTNPQSIVLDQPRYVTASFSGTANQTVTTNPPGLSILVDGQTYTAPQIFQWTTGSQHTIAISSPQLNGGTRSTFSGWSDGGAMSHLLLATGAPNTYTANFTTHYLLTTSASPGDGGLVTPSPSSPDGYYASGAAVQLTAAANSGYTFANWQGDLTGSVNPQSVTMSAPRNVSALFASTASRKITITTNPPGLMATVDGQSYTTPYTFQWSDGSQHQIGVNSPLTTGGAQWTQSTNIRYLFSNWSDFGTQTHTITVPPSNATYTAAFSTGYRLSTLSTTNGSLVVSPLTSDGFYTPGTVVQVTANGAAGYRLGNWTNDLSGSSNPQSITMDKPHSVSALFVPTTSLTLSCNPSQGPTQVGESYSAVCTAAGGTAPYAFSTSGSLPPGLASASTATTLTLSGSPTAASSYSFAVKVNDSASGTAQQAFSGTIAPANNTSSALSVTPGALNFTGYSGRGNPQAKTLSVSSTDGSSVAFTVSGLPSWLSVNPSSGSANANTQTLTVTPLVAGLPAGNTSGSITIVPASGPAYTVTVQVNISPFSISASNQLTEVLREGGSKQSTLSIATADGGAELVSTSIALSDAGNWFQLATNSLSAPGSLQYTMNAANLATGNYKGTLTLSCVSPSPCDPVQVAINLAVGQAKPVITQILNATGEDQTIAQNTWIEVKGTNLALTSRTWESGDFDAAGNMPTKLDGVSVTVNGKPAYVWYISPTQINVLTPLDAALGPVQVVVTNSTGISNATVVELEYSLGLFAFFSDKYAAATHANGGLLGPAALIPGSTTPAKPGETIILYGNGFGQITPNIAAGSSTQFGVLETKPTFTIGGLPAVVQWSGAVAPGLYQFNVEVPASAPDGDLPISAMYRGYSIHPGVMLSVAR